jgi:membrane protein
MSATLPAMFKASANRASLVKEIWKQTLADDCLDLAAQMSFYFVLSLFPIFIVFAAIVGWLPSTTLWQSFAHWITRYLPPESRQLVFGAILDLRRKQVGFFSLGLLGTLWSASSGVVSAMESLTVARGGKETRGFWEKRSIAVGVIIAGALFCMASFAALRFGRWSAEVISTQLKLSASLQVYWHALRWAATLILMCLAIDLVNHFLPDMKRRWRWLPPGTIFVALAYVGASAGFDFYIHRFAEFPKVYGALAGFVILMLWIYMASLILLVGAEIERVMDAEKNRVYAPVI